LILPKSCRNEIRHRNLSQYSKMIGFVYGLTATASYPVYRVKQSSKRCILDADLKFMLELDFYFIGLSLAFRQVVQLNQSPLNDVLCQVQSSVIEMYIIIRSINLIRAVYSINMRACG
jgi:hypothetical protein